MKYGVYYFKNTHNIGDDIWAYAQSLFYPHIDYLIDNTSLYKFRSKNDEDVATIIGAFVEPRNYEWCFLPPSNIIPFFTGAYFRSTMWEFLQNAQIIRYLKAFAPIGTRTTAIAEKFKDLGIDAYYSGCVTLTFPEMKKRSGGYICLVDVPEYVEDYVRKNVGNNIEIKIITHDLPNLGEEIFLKHRELSIEERFEKVRELIQIYADARCVVTSKLHCALPCLTQHTPVLLTLPRDGRGIVDMYERMQCFFELFNMSWYEDFREGAVDYDFKNPPDNPDTYLNYRENLLEHIGKFISDCEKGNITRRKVFNEEERLNILTEILEDKVFQLKGVIDSKNKIIEDKQDGILKLQRRLRKYESFNEWENVEFFGDWSDRSQKLSEFISDDCTSILDVGCGEMHIRKYLKKGIKYYGCDYKKREEDTLVCDLSIGEFPDVDVCTCFMAGVLEYLQNWKDVLKNMSLHCDQIIMSYSTSEEAEVRDARWVNNISEMELIRFLESCGFQLKEKKKVNFSSMGYNFMKEKILFAEDCSKDVN